mgnify:CR=1 FL=1
MPTYEYVCASCGHHMEQFQTFSEKPLTTCPKCKKKKLERQFGSGAATLAKVFMRPIIAATITSQAPRRTRLRHPRNPSRRPPRLPKPSPPDPRNPARTDGRLKPTTILPRLRGRYAWSRGGMAFPSLLLTPLQDNRPWAMAWGKVPPAGIRQTGNG